MNFPCIPRFSVLSLLVTALAALSFSNPASAAVVINDPTFSTNTTDLASSYKVTTPSSSAHNITSLTATSFLAFASTNPTANTYSVTFYADNAGSRGAALTSAISSSSVTGLLSASPAASAFYRFEVTFDLTSSPVQIGTGAAFWYQFSSSKSDQNVFIKSSTPNYGNGWGTGISTSNTPGIVLSAETVVPVPEPGTWAPAALIVGWVAFARRRKRARVS